MINSFRSLIFVPGNNPKFLEKSKSLSADIVCLDLEDSVPGAEKKNARNLINDILADRDKFICSMLFVRVNTLASNMIQDDLTEIIHNGLDGIVLPKINDINELQKIEQMIMNLEKKQNLSEGKIKIAPSIESTKGVVNSYEIASFSSRVSMLVFGIFDLLHDLQVEYTPQISNTDYSRSKVPVDARAAGVPAIDAIWQDINNTSGLVEDCALGHSLGYSGKCVIHPNQLDTVHKIYHPSDDSIAWARQVCDVYTKSIKEGKGATTVDGKMIDEVHYKQACDILKSVE
ncbi:MAG: CoA ester lyase [Candidatus Nitrosoabyssus spongiisocia]|nr:MAG: CoA ester lyase [Nitrosopumilaceae archaeon AB1(1)]